MNDIMCRYPGDREQVIVSYVYGEIDADERAQFDAHLATCARCRTELSAFSEVRGQLVRWVEPELEAGIVDSRQSTVDSRQSAVDSQPSASTNLQSPIFNLQFRDQWWWRVPAWAQVAAAMVFLGIGAAIANLDVRYDAAGLHLRTGWLRGSDSAVASSARPAGSETPTRAELTALEERLRAELVRAAPASGGASGVGTSDVTAANAGSVNAESLRRVRALVDESERRQQRELALRIGELVRDVNAQRQSDLVRIDRSLGVIQNNTGVEMMRQRETLNNILVRTSLQK